MTARARTACSTAGRAAANFPQSAGALNLEKIATAAGGAADAKCAQAGIERIAAGLGG